MTAPSWLLNFGFTGERRAVSLLTLALLWVFYLLVGLNALVATPELAPYLLSMGAVYLIGFFAVAAEWFWARWYAQGIAWSGVIEAVFGLLAVVRMRSDFPPEVLRLLLIFFGVLGSLHALTGAALLGPRIGALYDGREDWRKRWQLDDEGARRLRRTVTRAATSLPMIIGFALAPRQDDSMLGLIALVLGAVGLSALLRGRSAGLLGIGAAGAALVVNGLITPLHLALVPGDASPLLPSTFVPAMPLLAGALMLAAFAPFARPIASHLLRPQR